MKVAAMILAAGASRRFGLRNKLLVPLEGKPVLAHVLALAAQSCDRVIAVTPPDEAVMAEVTRSGAQIAINDAAAEGMGTSLACGIAALPDEADAALVFLGDMPWIQPTSIAALHQLAVSADGATAPVLRPRHQGQAGHPVLFRRVLFPVLKTLSGDQGARRLLAARRHDVAYADVDDPGVLGDIDTPGDLSRGLIR